MYIVHRHYEKSESILKPSFENVSGFYEDVITIIYDIEMRNFENINDFEKWLSEFCENESIIKECLSNLNEKTFNINFDDKYKAHCVLTIMSI